MNLDNSSTFADETPTSSGLAVGNSDPNEEHVTAKTKVQHAHPTRRFSISTIFCLEQTTSSPMDHSS